jgi:hypothetical protein
MSNLYFLNLLEYDNTYRETQIYGLLWLKLTSSIKLATLTIDISYLCIDNVEQISYFFIFNKSATIGMNISTP